MARAATAPARSRRARSAPARHAPVVRRLGPGEALRRRLSGPAPAQGAPRPAATRAAASAGGATVALPGRVLRAPFARAARTRTVGLLDALLQGRAWVALVGVLLAGIVFFNVDVLQLNREIAHTAERATKVKRENAALQLELAKLGSSERIQSAAAKRGLQLPAPGDVRYLKLRPRLDGGLAASRIVAPGTDVETPVAAAPPAAQMAPTAQQEQTPPTAPTAESQPQPTQPTAPPAQQPATSDQQPAATDTGAAAAPATGTQ